MTFLSSLFHFWKPNGGENTPNRVSKVEGPRTQKKKYPPKLIKPRNSYFDDALDSRLVLKIICDKTLIPVTKMRSCLGENWLDQHLLHGRGPPRLPPTHSALNRMSISTWWYPVCLFRCPFLIKTPPHSSDLILTLLPLWRLCLQ